MLNEQISDELLPKFSLSLIQDYKYKKLEIDKKLDEIVNKKIDQLKKEFEHNKENGGFPYMNGAYAGEYNKDAMPNGNGFMKFQPSENIYMGQFDSGLRHGIGEYIYWSGGGSAHYPFQIPYYAGEWFADSYHGLGKHFITEFEFLYLYEGTHTHDLKNGFGTYKKFEKEDQKICNTELIGYFANGNGFQFMIEINRDDNGNLAKDVPSGLLEYDMENGSKMPLSTFNEISEWEKVKPKKMDKDISNIFNAFYDPYFKVDPFTKKYSDLRLETKKNVTKLMFDSNKYFEKNSEDKSYFEFLTKVVALNEVINKVGENDKLIELKEEIEEAKKEFIIIEKKLKY